MTSPFEVRDSIKTSLQFDTVNKYNLHLDPSFNASKSTNMPAINWANAKVTGRKWDDETTQSSLQFHLSYIGEDGEKHKGWFHFRADTATIKQKIDNFCNLWNTTLKKRCEDQNMDFASTVEEIKAELAYQQSQNQLASDDEAEGKKINQKKRGRPAAASTTPEKEDVKRRKSNRHVEEHEEKKPSTRRQSVKNIIDITPKKTSVKKQDKTDDGDDDEEEEEEESTELKSKRQFGYLYQVYKETYEPEEIKSHKKDTQTWLFEVKWLGYSNKDNTWEPPTHLKHYADLIFAYCEREDCLNVFAECFPADPRAKRIKAGQSPKKKSSGKK